LNQSRGIYRIVAPSGSCYIGMTAKSFAERWKGHEVNFRKGQMTCNGLRRAFEKYGLDRMQFEVLEAMPNATDSEILAREKTWWLRHKSQGVNLYNGEPTGTGSVLHTEETRNKIAAGVRASLNLQEKDPSICGVCGKSFTTRFATCSIECRSVNRTLVKLSKEELEALYWDERLTARQIGETLSVTAQTVRNQMRRLGVPRRPERSSKRINRVV